MKNYDWLNNWLNLLIYLRRIKKINDSYARSILVFALGMNLFQIAEGETFSPKRVSLPQDVISSPFEAPRNNGPHKGTDISESMTNPIKFQPFSSGVWGVIVPPLGGPWGTVTIDPLFGANHKVQHLHSSSLNVSVGDIVSPWLILGSTGITAPPGITISGVHLHAQVTDEAGTPKYPEWDRAYVNPALWDTGNPLKPPGNKWWPRIEPDSTDNGVRSSTILYLRPLGDEIGDMILFGGEITAYLKNGNKRCTLAYDFKGNISQRKTNTVVGDLGFVSCNVTPYCEGHKCECLTMRTVRMEIGMTKVGRPSFDWKETLSFAGVEDSVLRDKPPILKLTPCVSSNENLVPIKPDFKASK